MPLSVNIKEIDRRGARCTYIRVGKTEYEIPGGLAALKRAARDTVESMSPLQLALLRIAAHIKTDPDLQDVAPILGRASVLTIDGKDVD